MIPEGLGRRAEPRRPKDPQHRATAMTKAASQRAVSERAVVVAAVVEDATEIATRRFKESPLPSQAPSTFVMRATDFCEPEGWSPPAKMSTSQPGSCVN